jgi:GDP-4-dehydro-6-deoxy-D-mannose reductase
MRTLVTGVTGFVGGHLAEALLSAGDTVLGVARRSVWPNEWIHLAERVPLLVCDLATDDRLTDLLRETTPDRIVHLAGYAHAGQSFAEPDAAWTGNLTASRRLYDAVARWGGRCRILAVSSGMVYGDAEPDEPPLSEASPLRPASPYAASKAAADLLGYQVTRHPGLDLVRARPFNHIGPRQSATFAVAHFAQQLTAIERGDRPPVLETGDLGSQRDLTDVRDVVAAYLLLLANGRKGAVYNVGSGRSVSMQTVLDRLITLTGLRVEVRRRADLLRPTDARLLRVDPSLLRREVGWQPRFDLERTLADVLAYWRTQRDPAT